MTQQSPVGILEAMVVRRSAGGRASGTPAGTAPAPSRASARASSTGLRAGRRAPAPPEDGSGRYRLRGRHIREHRMVRVGMALAAADIAVADDLLVLQVLRWRAGDLDPAQVAAYSALPPSVVASALDRLVRSGLARDSLVDGRVRFGLP